MNEEKKWYTSCSSEKMSMTIKGIGIAVIPIIIFGGKLLNIEFLEGDLTELLNAVAVASSSVLVAYALIRKLFYKYSK